MLPATRTALLLALLVAVTISPLGAVGSVQHSNLPLDKRSAVSDGSQCWTEFASDPKNCPIVQVAFFEDTQCSQPLQLVKTTPNAFIKGNKQMLSEGAVAHSVKKPFGSIRVLATVADIGIGFAVGEESDTVVQNMAFMSAAETRKAYQSKSCVTFPNLEVGRVGVWSTRSESLLNQGGYVWNPFNIPIKSSASQCNKHNKRVVAHADQYSVCLNGVSWGGGGVIYLYPNDDCSGRAKRQIYSTVQCTPLAADGFKSFKAVSPQGDTINPIFSPSYYDFNGETGYHACSQKGVTEQKWKPGQCQKFGNSIAFAGVYGNDPGNPQPGPRPNDKVLKSSHGGKPNRSPAPGLGRVKNI
ncbi:hypothetical protein NDA17_002783 [Ustilago hordei]|nr:hypothetical protein NDA17_002783 [Ustilago hordei]